MKEASVLIVEDEGLIALHLQELLENAGYKTRDPVPSGEAAITCIRTTPHPDLILMDITLAGKLNGIETAREIQKSFAIPIIFLTAHTQANWLASAKDLGSCGFLRKPVDAPDLLSAIRKALDP